jgi:hypothetical protein
MMIDDVGFTLLHNLQRMDFDIWPGYPIGSKVVAFGGDIRPSNSTPNIFDFNKDERNLIMWVYLPLAPPLQTIKKYKPSLCNDQKYAFVWGATDNKTDTVASTRMIPIPMKWVLMFIDGSNFGTAFWRLVDLFDSLKKMNETT